MPDLGVRLPVPADLGDLPGHHRLDLDRSQGSDRPIDRRARWPLPGRLSCRGWRTVDRRCRADPRTVCADAVDDVGNAADVVEVAVGDNHGADFILALFEVLGVRENVVNTGGITFFC